MEHNNDFLSIECNQSLVRLLEETGYPMVQENGQRKFGPPPNWKGPAPEKGCEVFIGKIPRTLYEDELVPVFRSIGFLYEFRLMMDFSGTNRGYAFAMYTSIKDAKSAVLQLNNYEIRKGKHIGVVKSVDNCRLFVGNIPKTKTSEEVAEEMRKVTEGVSHVILYTTPRDKTKNRGFAFIEYESHRAAAMARRKLIPGRIHLWGQQVMVDWAEPEPEVDDDIMSKVKVLYIRNLTEVTSEEEIREFFNQMEIDGVEKVKKLRDFAFVHFEGRQEAEYAIEKLQGAVLDDCPIEVTWAKPPEKVPHRSDRFRQYNLYDDNGPSSQQQMMRFVTQPVTPNQVRHLSGAGFDYNRNRNRSAVGVRNSRGFLNGMLYGKAPEFRFFGVPSLPMHAPGMPFFPTNSPLALHHHHHHLLRTAANTSKYPNQILHDLCQKWNLGEPIYNLISPQQNSTSGPSSTDVHLYSYKVTIPAYGPINTLTKMSATSEEAKQYAAASTLQALEPVFGPYGNSVPTSDFTFLSESNKSSSSSPTGSCFSSPTRDCNFPPSQHQSPMCFVTSPSPEYGSPKYPMSSFSQMASNSENYLANYYALASSNHSSRPSSTFSSYSAATSDFGQLNSATVPGMQQNLVFLSPVYSPPTGGGHGSSNVSQF